MSTPSTTPRSGYSAVQIALHWGIAALIIYNIIFGEDMDHAWRAYEHDGNASALGALGPQVHIWVGMAVLAFALWRIVLRRRGVPAAPVAEPASSQRAARITHGALYAVMVLMPLTGIAVYYGGIGPAGGIHKLLKLVAILFIAIHLLGALYQAFILKSNVFSRMVKPQS